mmetsp:Transcript_14337/g.25753  ORF Transcript_14337/g.25753 Transcript_14337/m.25753 type:complete len:154 (-) Transcript_14337:12-473(-)
MGTAACSACGKEDHIKDEALTGMRRCTEQEEEIIGSMPALHHIKEPGEKEADAPESWPADVPGSIMDQMQGTWTRLTDGHEMGVISGSVFFWAFTFEHGPCPLEIEGSDRLSFLLSSERYEGQVLVGPPATIHWSDGEVWIIEEGRFIDLGVA